MIFYFVWEKRFHILKKEFSQKRGFPETFVVCDRRYIEFSKMGFFLAFRIRSLQICLCFFVFFPWSFCFTVQKRIAKPRAIHYCHMRSFVMNLLWFAQKCFFFKGACLVKTLWINLENTGIPCYLHHIWRFVVKFSFKFTVLEVLIVFI